LYIEKMSANSVRITLNMQDFKILDISFEKLVSGGKQSVGLVKDILLDSAEALKMDFSGGRVLAEIYKCEFGCIMVFTRLNSPKKICIHRRKVCFRACFNSAETLFSMLSKCPGLRFFASGCLYSYNNKFYLFLKIPRIKSDEIKMILSEFSEKCETPSAAFLEEHGKALALEKDFSKLLESVC
jgi:negative regulator of genetic competence, sporulation and motility